MHRRVTVQCRAWPRSSETDREKEKRKCLQSLSSPPWAPQSGSIPPGWSPVARSRKSAGNSTHNLGLALSMMRKRQASPSGWTLLQRDWSRSSQNAAAMSTTTSPVPVAGSGSRSRRSTPDRSRARPAARSTRRIPTPVSTRRVIFTTVPCMTAGLVSFTCSRLPPRRTSPSSAARRTAPRTLPGAASYCFSSRTP